MWGGSKSHESGSPDPLADALFAAVVPFADPSVLAAAEPAFLPVTPLDFVSDNALPDAVFAAFFAPSGLPALEAAFLPVFSLGDSLSHA